MPEDASSLGDVRDDPPFPLTVVVCAYNEERNLPNLLAAGLLQSGPSFVLAQLIAVASGCTDRSLRILEEAASRDPRVRVLVQSDRQGKGSALALAWSHVQTDLLLVENADTVPAPGAYEALIAPFRDPSVDLTCPRPVPTNGESGLIVRMGRTLWDVHDAVSRNSPKVGEAYALRRPAWGPSDFGEEDDDTFLGSIGPPARGRRIYARDAVVLNRVPTNPRELFRQRSRIARHVLSLRRRTGLRSATWEPILFIRSVGSYLLDHPGRWAEVVGLVFLEAAARGLATFAHLVRPRAVRMWEPLPSTKHAVEPLPSAVPPE